MWTLIYRGEKKSFAEWGVVDAKRTVWNQGPDQLRLKVALGHFESPFEAGELVSIWQGEGRFFEGRITRLPCYAKADQQFVTYEAEGPYADLQQLIYEQAWAEQDASSEGGVRFVYKSRVVLGQSPEGNPLSAREQVLDILQYARAAGAHFEIGSMDWDFPLPLDEAQDLSCAEALARVLRWAPDMTMGFDYAGSGLPVLQLKRASEADGLTLDLNAVPVKQLEVTPRPDLRVPAVVLKYESTHRVGSEVWSTTAVEVYPPEAPPRQLKAVVLTLELDGARAVGVEQSVEVEPIEPDSVAWWRSHLPSLQAVPVDAITIESFARDGSLPNALVKGSIADWMGCRAEVDTVRATLSYRLPNGSIIQEPVSLQLLTTDSPTKAYFDFQSISSAEQVPVGLAKALYEGLAPLYHEGSVGFVAQGGFGAGYLGQNLQLLNGRPEWAHMKAVVQSVHYALATDEVVLKFGPAKHLGLDQLSEIFRTNRRRGERTRAFQRNATRPGRPRVVSQPKFTRVHNTERGMGNLKCLVLQDGDTPRITLDATQIADGHHLTLREEHVCQNGVLLKRMVLATDPYLIHKTSV
jgi:hypothetical protein